MMIFPRTGFGRGADSVVLVLFWVLGSVLAKDTAFVEVVLFESSPNGDYTTYTTGLQGSFSRAGATISAEGEIVQGWISLQACDYITSHLWCSFISQALLSQLFEEPAGAFDLSALSGLPARPILSAQAAHFCSTQNQIPKPLLSLSPLVIIVWHTCPREARTDAIGGWRASKRTIKAAARVALVSERAHRMGLANGLNKGSPHWGLPSGRRLDLDIVSAASSSLPGNRCLCFLPLTVCLGSHTLWGLSLFDHCRGRLRAPGPFDMVTLALATSSGVH
ncbi:E3 ubiquitin-protein ligase znrf3 [Triplophysa tibetana]|uniref:E3 ubiquitin-protein ligase znrf3 n=1 Tax=Triplophysa tibetana TaxID=1572043 RepID=A0A5A9P4U8_9TELE|nr:E3 ubiquitin-protein ligase znrf3 [Triplophysa tibetana]